jgi:hypothetical protein
MDYIIQLLKDRNLHLEKFAQLNESEMLRFDEGNFDNLESFYKSREGILNLVACIDKLIEETECDPALPDAKKRQVLDLLTQKNEIVTEILSQDLQILSMIERAKSEIIKELSTVKAGRKALHNYQSGHGAKRIDGKY